MVNVSAPHPASHTRCSYINPGSVPLVRSTRVPPSQEVDFLSPRSPCICPQVGSASQCLPPAWWWAARPLVTPGGQGGRSSRKAGRPGFHHLDRSDGEGGAGVGDFPGGRTAEQRRREGSGCVVRIVKLVKAQLCEETQKDWWPFLDSGPQKRAH